MTIRVISPSNSIASASSRATRQVSRCFNFERYGGKGCDVIPAKETVVGPFHDHHGYIHIDGITKQGAWAPCGRIGDFVGFESEAKAIQP
ncbi:uncharacterized protein G2W53_019523 [Senna tora]|uniref:Uncharacterized protein n=1 Tax=Senna tora TaxID=362788 RepID=A0A834U264_9FABA|nr:uncharacterized protein G2W53_019523 [Senna tora]